MRVVKEWRTLFVGANNSAFVFDLDRTLESSTATKIDWMPDSVAKKKCRLKGKEEHDCQTYVKIVTPDLTNGRVLICGTNAPKPKCIHVTSVFAEGSLYAGTVADFNGRDSALTRSMGNAVPLITKRHDSLWLNHPKFVGSFVDGREVFFLFREVSVENCEKIYRSRIARVCTDDKGGRTILDSSWTTFLKARLDCSFRGEFPFRFNYLQDVVRTVRGGKVFYYAVFTTGEHEISASAICRFGLDDIRDNFERGPFLRPTAPWGRIPDEDVPDNRPGDCSVDSTLLSYEDLNFVKSHPSLYEPVGSGDPLFTLVRQNYRLKTLTVTET
ncbi:semaphorin-1A-like, partial [Anneissia japonica]|uniref:semaphorin-1A-like n=1 Tax=Anneissia japonica TaxID=1529436 RepID=UPI0014255458